ncbi:disintegrin and metalloproteinase domain-containing protein 10 [Biomphalaria glabrata]|nr:hypothetical protein BgiMline_027270 [Biomphalaria glabrata]
MLLSVFLLANFLLRVTVEAQSGKNDEYLGVCDQPWLPAYSHDHRGVASLGSLNNLQNQLLNGYMVRVQFSTKEFLITLDLEDFTFKGMHVCGSATYLFSDNGTHIETDPDWLPTLVCTNGEVSRINFTSANWTSPVGLIDVELDGEIWWFTKPTQSSKEPIYSQFIDGSTASGSLTKLLRYAKWSELRANMRDRGFAFVLKNQKIYNDEVVTAQSLNHYSLRYTKTSVKFNEEPYYSWIASWSTNGRRDVSRWYLTNSTQYKHNNDYVSLDWFGDECWRKVYSTDVDGFSLHGSLEELMSMIKLGHRVRVYFNGYNLKVNGIRVLKGMVIAQTIEEFGRRGNYSAYDATFFDARVKIIFRLIHSTGKVKTFAYYYDNFGPVNTRDNEQSEKFAIDWVVDTRPWKKVLRTDAFGTATFGYTTDLETANTMGCSVRLNIEQDELGGQFFTEADNVRYNIAEQQIFAQALKHVSDQRSPGVDEYTLQSNVFRWSLMVSSNGVVAMNARHLSSRNHLYDAISPATNVTWFINC